MDEGELQFSRHVDSCGLETVGTNEKKPWVKAVKGFKKWAWCLQIVTCFATFLLQGTVRDLHKVGRFINKIERGSCRGM